MCFYDELLYKIDCCFIIFKNKKKKQFASQFIKKLVIVFIEFDNKVVEEKKYR
jgi:hypothetical protein